MSKQLISGPEIPKLELVHEDDRRAIREAELNLPDGTIRRVTHLAIKGAGTLGNHYHPIPEHFSVINGNPTIATAPKDAPEHVRVRQFPNGGHVTMEPGEVHTFQFDGPGDLISTMDSAFDPDHLIPFKLEVPPRQGETPQPPAQAQQ